MAHGWGRPSDEILSSEVSSLPSGEIFYGLIKKIYFTLVVTLLWSLLHFGRDFTLVVQSSNTLPIQIRSAGAVRTLGAQHCHAEDGSRLAQLHKGEEVHALVLCLLRPIPPPLSV